MNDKHLSKQAISFFVLLAVVVIAAFVRSGWIGGLHALSFAINIVGYIILLVVKLLGATLPSLTEAIVQNVITTVLIWLVCTVFWLGKKRRTHGVKNHCRHSVCMFYSFVVVQYGIKRGKGNK